MQKNKRIMTDIELDFDKEYEQNVKKGRNKKLFFIIFTLVIIAILIFTMNVFKVKSIEVTGNSLLSDEDVLKLSNIKAGDNYFYILSKDLSSKISKNDLVEYATIELKDFNKVIINVKEAETLFKTDDKVMLTTGILVDSNSYNILNFANYNEAPRKNEIFAEILELYNQNNSVYEHISEVKFSPTVVNDERIAFVMRDTNIIYVDIDEISKIMSMYFKIVDSVYSEYGKVYGEYHFDEGGEFDAYK